MQQNVSGDPGQSVPDDGGGTDGTNGAKPGDAKHDGGHSAGGAQPDSAQPGDAKHDGGAGAGGTNGAQPGGANHGGGHGGHVSEATALERFSNSAWAWGKEIVTILAIALVLSFLIKTFLFRAFYIPSGSMENTLRIDDRIFVNLLVPEPFALKRGDVVVFKDTQGWLPPESVKTGPFSWIGDVATFIGVAPDSSQQHLVKRVIGLPGDHVKCCDAAGKLTINGTAITEPYLFPGASPSDSTFDVTVPAGHIWVMGDHRNNSEDSRAHQKDSGTGFVPISDVEGRAVVIAWPLNHTGILGNYPDVFAKVPEPSAVGQGSSSGVIPAGQ